MLDAHLRYRTDAIITEDERIPIKWTYTTNVYIHRIVYPDADT